MSSTIRSSARSPWVRGGVVIAILACVLIAPGRAEAHGRSSVIALDYQARLAEGGAVAAGVHARVLDGDRKLELSVDPTRTVVVRGYAGEAFVRFSRGGVFVNASSPTAVADKLAPPDATPAMGASSPPRWEPRSRGHTLAWHDHRLGPRASSAGEAGMVGSWSIPLVVDGTSQTIEGRLWRAAKPSLWPWLLVWLIALVAAAAALRTASRHLRLLLLASGAPLCAALVFAVSVGFTSSSARSGWTRWFDLAFPAALAAVAALVPFLRPRHRVSAAACVAGFAFAAALQNVPVFAHGFVVSWLPAQVVRAAVALALATGGFVLMLALAELWRGTPHGHGRPVPRPQPRMAIPRGRAR